MKFSLIPGNNENLKPANFFAVTLASIFIAEWFIMAVFQSLNISLISAQVWLLDAGLLVILLVPQLYIFLYRPMKNYLKEKNDAQQELIKANDNLEEKVKERTNELNKMYLRDKAILNSISDGYICMDNEYYITSINQEALRILSYKNGDVLVGKNIWSEFPDYKDTVLYDRIVKASKEKTADCFEHYSKTLARWLKINIYPSEESMLVIFNDITYRKKTEESLDFYLNLFQDFPALIWRAGTDANCDYFNRTWLEFTGRTLEQEMDNGWTEGVHPEDFNYCYNTYINAFNNRQSFEMEYRLRRYDGEYRWIVDLGRPIYDNQGEFMGYLGSCYDHTELRKTKESLLKSELRYRTLLKHSSVGLFVFDPITRKIQEANNHFLDMLGYDEEEIKNMRVDDIVIAETKNIEANVQRVLQGEIITGHQRQYIHKNGNLIDVEPSVSLIDYDNEKVCLVNVIDITERKKASEALEKSLEDLQITLKETVNALVTVAEKRDPYTAGHQHQVAKLACAIAVEMGLENTAVEAIEIAGKVHDIGKIYVPTDILNKPGKLTDMEMGIIKCHPSVGQEILCKIPFRGPVAQIVAQHHERYDGSGYPNGLAGEDILLEARILAVADVVEAMASHRPYRAAIGLEKALEELSRNKGIYYDPLVVEACVNVFTHKKIRLENVIKTELDA